MKIKVDLVLPNPDQPRKEFDEAELNGLAQSIQENGLIQPIVVVKAGDHYILVDGERRLRAVKLLKLTEIEAAVRTGGDRLTQALVANIQRADMSPIDEARAFKRLLKELKTQTAVAEKLGVSAGFVSQRLALLDFPKEVQSLFNLKKIPLENTLINRMGKLTPEQQTRVATVGAARGWSVNAFNKMLAREIKGKRGPAFVLKHGPRTAPVKIDGHFDALALVENHRSLPAPIIKTARKTCQACDLYSAASLPICKQCPLPDFLRRYRETQPA